MDTNHDGVVSKEEFQKNFITQLRTSYIALSRMDHLINSLNYHPLFSVVAVTVLCSYSLYLKFVLTTPTGLK